MQTSVAEDLRRNQLGNDFGGELNHDVVVKKKTENRIDIERYNIYSADLRVSRVGKTGQDR